VSRPFPNRILAERIAHDMLAVERPFAIVHPDGSRHATHWQVKVKARMEQLKRRQQYEASGAATRTLRALTLSLYNVVPTVDPFLP